jgi:hypothetical protein
MTEPFHDAAAPVGEETGPESVQVTADAAEPTGERPEVDRTEVEPTGDEDVDAVVASLARLDDLPVAEHVAVFEQAHESLRRTLAGAGHDGPAAGRS